MERVFVNADNFARAETDRMFAALLQEAGGVNRWHHHREPVALDEQTVIRSNLIGTAAGWGGLPDQHAYYVSVDQSLPVGKYLLTLRDVPVDGFWSISVYNADGFFEANDRDANSVNSLTAVPNEDALVTVHFGGCADDRPNCLPIMEGWNYTVRLYLPRPEILDGTWTFPAIEPA